MTHNESSSSEEEETTQWLWPFLNNSNTTPQIKIKVDSTEAIATVDSGASRVMITSEMAKEVWGKEFKSKLAAYSNRTVTDAQNKPVTVLGIRHAWIKIGDHLRKKFPIIIYQASHKEMLLGYAFLAQFRLAIYANVGIGTQPKLESVRRFNFHQEQLECHTTKYEYIPPQAVKVVTARINPETWSERDRIKAIGMSVCTHSEDIEKVPVQSITCPFTYDVIGPQADVHVVIDNTGNLNPLHIEKGKMIAHAEFLLEQVPQEEVEKILQLSEIVVKEDSIGELEKKPEDNVPRFEYVDKVDVKTDDADIKNFCNRLLRETEPLWAKHSFDIGKFDQKARVTMKSTRPIRDKIRPINPKVEEEAREIIEQLQKHRLITKANSPYCSNPVFVRKKPPEKKGKGAVAGELQEGAKGKLRIVLDYRKINEQIEANCNYPIPSIKGIIHKLRGAKYVSMVDLSNGYWNIELTDSSKPIFAFHCNNSLFVWERLPMGCSVAQGIMAEAVDRTVQEEGLTDCCQIYVDNLLVVSDSIEDHKKDLQRTFQAFSKRGWKANPGKSTLFINDCCRLFGFHVDLKKNTISPDPKKVEKIKELPHPTNHRTARSFAGAINYYNDLLPNLAPLMLPIFEATKKGTFTWTEECRENFEKIKTELCKMPCIYMPDFSKPMHLFTDAAAGQFLSYCVQQKHEKFNKYLPIAWGSHKFSNHECSFSQPESEMYAIVYSLQQEAYLLGFSKTIVHSDCKALTFLFKFSKFCSKLNRWQLILNSFDIEIFFEPSDSIGMIIVDILSRRPGMKKVANRRPKKHEVDELPDLQLTEPKLYSMTAIKQIIQKRLEEDQTASPHMLNHLKRCDVETVVEPSDLKCNRAITARLRKNGQLDVSTQIHSVNPELKEWAGDITPTGKLMHLILSEAPGMSLQALRNHQLQDAVFGPIIKEMVASKQTIPKFALKNGILLRETEDNDPTIPYVICIPKKLAQTLVQEMHHNIFGGHADLKKLMCNIKKRFYVKSLRKECAEVIQQCKICAFNKSFSKKKQPFGRKIQVTGARQIWALDLCTIDTKAVHIDPTLPTSFLIAVDAWALYTVCIPIHSNPTAKEILQKFTLHVIQPFGIPSYGITIDNGSNFSNKLLNKFTAALGLQQFRISPYNARANVAERMNRSIIAGLRYSMQQFKLEPEVFRSLVSYITLAWNTSVLSSIGFSPYRLFMSKDYAPAASTSFITVQEAENETYGEFVTALGKTQHIIENLVNEKYRQIRDKRYRLQTKKSANSEYSPGTLVMVKILPDKTQRAHKLRPRFKGPYKIIAEFENNVEVINWSPDRKVQYETKYKNQAEIPKFDKHIVHKDRLKPVKESAFYYDQNLARKFYNIFWDNIKDATPITSVVRQYKPATKEDDQPQNRPSSLILPTQLGIKTNVKPFGVEAYTNLQHNQRRKPPSTSTDDTDDDSVSHKIGPTSRDHNTSDPTPEDRRETSPSSQYSMSDATDESQEEGANLELPDVPTKTSQTRPEKDISLGAIPKTPNRNQWSEGSTSTPVVTRPKLITPKIKERWIVGVKNSDSVLVIPGEVQTAEVESPPKREGQKIAPNVAMSNQSVRVQPPRNAKITKTPQSVKSKASSKSIKSKSASKKQTAEIPERNDQSTSIALAEEELEAISVRYTENMNREITSLTETIRGSFENLESEIENILSD